MRVFVSHSFQDKAAVLALAEALRERGIDPWMAQWKIGPTDDFVAGINQGLHESDAGIIVVSSASAASRWVGAETSYLTKARIEGNKTLVVVVLDDSVVVPPLLDPLIRHRIADIDAIADALHNRKPVPVTPPGTRPAGLAKVLVSLRRGTGTEVQVTVDIDGTRHGDATFPGLPYELLEAQNGFLRGAVHGPRGEFRAADRAAREAALGMLGRHLGALCFPGDSGAALAALIDLRPLGTLVETAFAADDPALLGLAFEAACLPDGRVLALQKPVVTLRRPLTPPAHKPHPPLAGPLKILLAVAAPDASSGGGPLLDYERETQNVLDAVRDARTLENCQVRILEVGHPAPIADAFSRDAYHVLHLSCHGGPGVLELEDEDGNRCPTWASERTAPAAKPGEPPPLTLLGALRGTGRPPPLVLLNACHGGVASGQTASFAQELLAGGVPAVVAMLAPVSDAYAVRLADAFYRALATGERLRPGPALAEARRQIEAERLAAIRAGAPAVQTQPEYATAALFVAGSEQPVADFHLTKEPLRAPPVHELRGVVPQLSLGELIGRRRELRDALGVLRDPERRRAGVVLTGIGGIGKSALAGRVMCRLAEQGWLVPAVRGPFSLTNIAVAIAVELFKRDHESELAQSLGNPNLPDPVRAQMVAGVLAEQSVLLVLDDFEQNLSPEGDSFLDPDVQEALGTLAAQARAGRLLLTCRYPLPGLDGLFRAIPVPPLSPAETRKKLLRLPALAAQLAAGTRLPAGMTGGHPRILEFLDALLSAAPERRGPVVEKLRALAPEVGVDLNQPAANMDDAARDALALAERDVLLPELLRIVGREGFAPALLQAAVSNLPVSAPGLARMLAGDGPGDAAAAEAALARLAALSLLYRDAAGAALVHRWTAEGLKRSDDDAAYRARCVRAAGYRWWRYQHEGQALDDAVEALRDFLAGAAFDEAAELAQALLAALSGARQSVAVAALGAEVLESLPEDHPGYNVVADAEAQAHLALGYSDRALRRYQTLLNRYELLARAEPDRADYQRDLSVSHDRMGDLYGALGQGEAARDAYARSLDIAERLARAEPDRADYQRDLSVSYNKMGDLYRALGQGEAARDAYARSLDIAERLARAEPDRADYQRDLSVSYNKMGDLYRALGQGEAARDAYARSLDIRERLARAEPDRADYQRDLSVSYNKMGDLYGALGQGEAARDAYARSLDIRERLARAEPDRADYQRDLSVSYNKMGDLYGALGQGEAARDAYARSLDIAERLARAEPDRADYQRDLSVSYNKMGDLYRALGQGEAARDAYARSLDIRERLARAEPDRADYQRDLSVSYNKMGDLYGALGQGEAARDAYARSLDIRERLARAEPDRADYQRDLSVSYEKMGDLYRALGQGEAARDAYARSLDIAERLARAEPDRADYQRDVVVSLVRQAQISEGAAARAHLLRALGIVEGLQASGRLAPADASMLPALRQMIDALPA